MSQILKAYFFCTFLGYNLYFLSRFFVLFLGDEPVATLEHEFVESKKRCSGFSNLHPPLAFLSSPVDEIYRHIPYENRTT